MNELEMHSTEQSGSKATTKSNVLGITAILVPQKKVMIIKCGHSRFLDTDTISKFF